MEKDKLDLKALEKQIEEQTRNGRDSVYIDKDILAVLTDNKDFNLYTSDKVFIGVSLVEEYIKRYKLKSL